MHLNFKAVINFFIYFIYSAIQYIAAILFSSYKICQSCLRTPIVCQLLNLQLSLFHRRNSNVWPKLAMKESNLMRGMLPLPRFKSHHLTPKSREIFSIQKCPKTVSFNFRSKSWFIHTIKQEIKEKTLSSLGYLS